MFALGRPASRFAPLFLIYYCDCASAMVAIQAKALVRAGVIQEWAHRAPWSADTKQSQRRCLLLVALHLKLSLHS